MEILRKQKPSMIVKSEPSLTIGADISELIERLKKDNLKDTESLVRMLDIYAASDDLSNPQIEKVLDKFLDVFDTRINDITSLVRGLSKSGGFDKLRKRYGGRYFLAFADYEKNEETNEVRPVIRRYRGKDADELFLRLVREIPGLSDSGGSVTRESYLEVLNLIQSLQNNELEVRSVRKRFDEIRNIEDKDIPTRVKEFKRIKATLLDVFTELATEVADFKDVNEEEGLVEEAIYMGLGATSRDGIKTYSELSGNLEESVDFLKDAYNYVMQYERDLLEAPELLDMQFDVEDEAARELASRMQQTPTQLGEITPKDIAEAKSYFSMMKRLVSNIDDYTFELTNMEDIVVEFGDEGK